MLSRKFWSYIDRYRRAYLWGYAAVLASIVMTQLAPWALKLGIPVTIHSAGSPAHPLEIGVLAEAFPDVPVIMDHMGYRNYVGAAIAAAKRAPNLYLMTTAVMEPHCIQDAVREIGAHRVVFGSNGPAVRPSTQILVIKQAELAPADERKVLGENAARLLRL